MSHGNKQQREPDPTLAGIDLSGEPSNQEATILPYVAGEYTLAAHWITPAYNQRAVEAPNERPSKK